MVVFAVLLLAPISWISVWMTFCTGVTLQCATLMKRRWRRRSARTRRAIARKTEICLIQTTLRSVTAPVNTKKQLS
jgi:hypothetical protein